MLVQMDSGQPLADLIIELWRARATVALIKPDMPGPHRSHVVESFAPHLIVSGASDTAIDASSRLAPASHPKPVLDGSITVFTSGTTGLPKGVVLPRESIAGNAMATAELHGFGEGRPHGSALSVYHVNALVMSLIGTELTGERLLLDASGVPERFFSRLAEIGARTASVNPQYLRLIVESDVNWPDSLDYLITAAGPCSADLAAAFYRRFGPRLRQGYGMSEAVNFSFMMPMLEADEFVAHYVAQRPPVGLPLPGTEFAVVGGEVWVKSQDVMAGYLGDMGPEVFSDGGWLRTGDLGFVRDGYLVLSGRAVDAVDVEGVRLAPGLIEDQRRDHFGGHEHAVVRFPAKAGLHRLGVFIDGPWTAELVDWILSEEKPPLAAVRTASPMVSGSGKVQRSAMEAQLVRERDVLEPLVRWAVQEGPRVVTEVLGSEQHLMRLFEMAQSLSLTSSRTREPSVVLVVADAGDPLPTIRPDAEVVLLRRGRRAGNVGPDDVGRCSLTPIDFEFVLAGRSRAMAYTMVIVDEVRWDVLWSGP